MVQENHLIKKIGTPTMGGLLILIGLFTGVLLWSDLTNPYNWLLIFILFHSELWVHLMIIKKLKQKFSWNIL